MLILYSLGALFQFIMHTTIEISGKYIQKILVTPQYHGVHHAKGLTEDKNLSFVLPIWDHLFGTFHDPKKMPNNYKFGLRIKSERSLISQLIGV